KKPKPKIKTAKTGSGRTPTKAQMAEQHKRDLAEQHDKNAQLQEELKKLKAQSMPCPRPRPRLSTCTPRPSSASEKPRVSQRHERWLRLSKTETQCSGA